MYVVHGWMTETVLERTFIAAVAAPEEGRNLKKIILYRISGLVIRVIMHIVSDILKFHVKKDVVDGWRLKTREAKEAPGIKLRLYT